MEDVHNAKSRANIDEYKKWVTDDAYKIAMIELVKRMIDKPSLGL